MSILDRYILKQLILTYIFSIIALCTIFLIVNTLENLDDFLDKDVSFEIIILYYLHFLPEIIKLISPIAILVSTLFTIGKMSTQNEITAMKAGGLSLYRIMIPLAFAGIFLSLGQLYFNGWIVPDSIQKKFEIEQNYLHKRISGGPIYNLYFRDDPLTNIVMQYYDAKSKTGNKISIERYNSVDKPRLLKRIEARRIVWDSSSHNWVLNAGIVRVFNQSKVITKRFDSMSIALNITHDKIMQIKRSPNEMNFDELKEFIDILEQGGKDVRKQRIEYYGNYAFPFANFIVILFGVPFASVRRKGGLAIQIGASLIISFVYLVFSKISQTMGFAAELDPVLSGWGANIIFFIFGIFTIFKTKT